MKRICHSRVRLHVHVVCDDTTLRPGFPPDILCIRATDLIRLWRPAGLSNEILNSLILSSGIFKMKKIKTSLVSLAAVLYRRAPFPAYVIRRESMEGGDDPPICSHIVNKHHTRSFGMSAVLRQLTFPCILFISILHIIPEIECWSRNLEYTIICDFNSLNIHAKNVVAQNLGVLPRQRQSAVSGVDEIYSDSVASRPLQWKGSVCLSSFIYFSFFKSLNVWL